MTDLEKDKGFIPWSAELAELRRDVARCQAEVSALDETGMSDPIDWDELADYERYLVSAHQAAAGDGYLGAYPLPPIGAVDQWPESAPGRAGDFDRTPDIGWPERGHTVVTDFPALVGFLEASARESADDDGDAQ